MSPPLRRWAGAALLLGSPLVAPGGVWIPPLTGALSGDLSPLGEATPLRLHWTLRASRVGEVQATIEGPGLSAAGRLEGWGGSGEPAWTLDRGRIDLPELWPALAARFPVLGPVETQGVVALQGDGQLGADLKSVRGRLGATLEGAAFRSASAGWSAEGVSFSLEFPRLPDGSTAPRQRLSIEHGTLGQVPFKNARVDLTFVPPNQLQVQSLRLEMLGGSVRAGAFTVDLQDPAISTAISVRGIDLGALQRYLPEALSEAQGKLEGRIEVRWSRRAGLAFGKGSLRLESKGDAAIRLAPTPGFLSSHVPAKLKIGPRWLSTWMQQPNPAFPVVESIELGREPLIVESIEAELQPEVGTQEATAVVRITARPKSTDRVKLLRLNVRVSGPLTDVLRFGMDKRMSVGR